MNAIYIKSKADQYLKWALDINTELQDRSSQQLNDLEHACDEQILHNPSASIRASSEVIRANCRAILDQRKVAVPTERTA